MRRAFSGEGAWNRGNDVDPKVEVDNEFPTRGKICEAMDYFDSNPTMIEKWDRLDRMDHPISGTHYYFQWLGYSKKVTGLLSTVIFSLVMRQVVALRGLDGARVDSHVTYSPDDGETYLPRTLEIGQTSTEYDSFALEQEGNLRLHSTFNIYPSPRRDTSFCCFMLQQGHISML